MRQPVKDGGGYKALIRYTCGHECEWTFPSAWGADRYRQIAQSMECPTCREAGKKGGELVCLSWFPRERWVPLVDPDEEEAP